MGIMAMLNGVTTQQDRPRPARAAYAGAAVSRLTSSLRIETESINRILRNELRILRARSRDAGKNNPYVKKFLKMCVDNICGATPFKLQSKARFNSGKLDKTANTAIENAWRMWSRKGQCEVTGMLAWSAFQRLLTKSIVQDGEVLLRIHQGPQYGRHGFQFQCLEIDRLDERLNKALPDGGTIEMGVEMDSMRRPRAYHLLKDNPTARLYGYQLTQGQYDVVSADQCIHLFIPDQFGQVRGVPWIHAALINLVHLGAFEEAAVIAARVGASAMGVIQSGDFGATLADGFDGTDAEGNPQIEAEPGTFPMLPPGYSLNSWSPQYPDAAVEPFLKACLRGISSGLDVAYHNLASDMEGVSYSSARVAELSERDAWMSLQSWLIEHLHEPVYERWLSTQTSIGVLPFNPINLNKYMNVHFQGRRWEWVDPEKEVKAQVLAINEGLNSRTKVIAQHGDDIEDVFNDLAAEQEMAAELGVQNDAQSDTEQDD